MIGFAIATRIRSASAMADGIVVDVFGDDDELVAAHARHGVAGPHRLAQPFRDRHEQPIAGRMAVAVVDQLEVVEVEVERGECHTGAAGASDPLLHPVEQELAVGETR